MTENHYIVWDLGATKCAAAWVSVKNGDYRIQKSHTVKLSDCHSLAEMSGVLHESLAVRPEDVRGVCIAGAGQYNGDELILHSQYPFKMCFAQLARDQSWAPYEVIHDYTPIVCSTYVKQSEASNRLTINSGRPDPCGQRIAFGVGSGLGVKHAARLRSGELCIGTNEMGHIGLVMPPLMTPEESRRHQDFVNFLQNNNELRDCPITFETVLSGLGLARLYQFINGSSKCLTPEDTAQAIKEAQDQETLNLFAWYLGLFIGTLQLTFMPSAGIWMYGGVIHKNLALFDAPYIHSLQRGIQVSSAYWEKRQYFPLHVLVGQDHAFLGGAYYAERSFDWVSQRQRESAATVC